MVQARKAKIGMEPFKLFVCRLQGMVINGKSGYVFHILPFIVVSESEERVL